MKILVTGGSGFIGTNLVSDLLSEGHDVLIYDKRPSQKYPDLCMVADVRDKEKLADSMRGIDAVYHLAAEHRDDVRPISLYYDVNVGGAENIVYGLEKNSVEKLIFTSTVAVYGMGPGERTEESPIRPFNDYGRSKYKSEVVFNKWADAADTRSLVIVRPAVIFGEENRGNVFNLLKQIASGSFVMVGNGRNKKSMGYVLNIAQFLTVLLKSSPGPGSHVYNYADKPDLDMNDLVRVVFNSLGKGNKTVFRIPYALGLLGGYAFDLMARVSGRSFPISAIRIKKFCADTRIAADHLKRLGFVAPYSLDEGLKRMISCEFSEAVR
jgi:GlcNAc-P-P-Und epimerase